MKDMFSFKCPICGGKLNIKIGSNIARCGFCGNMTELDSADVDKFRDVYRSAERLMNQNSVAKYQEAIAALDTIAFIDEADKLSEECKARIAALEADKKRREEFERQSEKRDTVFGIVLLVITLILCAAAVAGLIYFVIALSNGTLSNISLTVVIGLIVLAVISVIVDRLKH